MQFLRFRKKEPDAAARAEAFAATLRARGRFITLIMDVGNLCNIRCRFCHMATEPYRGIKADNYTRDEFLARFGTLLPHIHMLQLSCGAEPFMNPHFTEILRALKDFGGRIQFSTNGMLVNDPAIAAISELHDCEIAISIDGSEVDTVEWLRDRLKYDKMAEKIRALVRARDAQPQKRITITAAFSIVEPNLRQVPLFVAVAKELGFDLVRYRMVEMDDLFSDEIREKMRILDPALVPVMLAQAQARGQELGIEIDIPSLLTVDEMMARAKTSPDLPEGEPFCNWPFDHIFVDSVNVRRTMRKVLPCPYWPDTPADESEQGDLLSVFQGSFFSACREALIDRNKTPEWCKKCPIGLGRF
ncbi:MAG: radical SAM protein [Planctomycetota bacterium]